MTNEEEETTRLWEKNNIEKTREIFFKSEWWMGKKGRREKRFFFLTITTSSSSTVGRLAVDPTCCCWLAEFRALSTLSNNLKPWAYLITTAVERLKIICWGINHLKENQIKKINSSPVHSPAAVWARARRCEIFLILHLTWISDIYISLSLAPREHLRASGNSSPSERLSWAFPFRLPFRASFIVEQFEQISEDEFRFMWAGVISITDIAVLFIHLSSGRHKDFSFEKEKN